MEISFRYRFEAAHRFISSCSPKCQTPHGHSWYVKLSINSSDHKLNSTQMIAEFDSLKKNWKKFIDETADHSFFYNNDDPLLPYFEQHVDGFRGLPFPGEPTTEMVAVLLLKKAQSIFSDKTIPQNIKPSAITIDETPTNSVTLSINSPIFTNTISKLTFNGWWNENDITNRKISLKKLI